MSAWPLQVVASVHARASLRLWVLQFPTLSLSSSDHVMGGLLQTVFQNSDDCRVYLHLGVAVGNTSFKLETTAWNGVCIIVLSLLPFRMHIYIDSSMHINSCKLHILFLLVLPAPRLLQLKIFCERVPLAGVGGWIVSGSDGGRVGGVLQGCCRGCYRV
jgi:hypothetical protein